MRKGLFVLLVVLAAMGTGLMGGGLMACGPKPSLPSEEEARKTFYERQDKIRRVEDALRKEIGDAHLATAPPSCVPPDDPACLTALRARDQAIAAGQKRLQAVLASIDVACAEITVTSRAKAVEVLAARVATCPIGRRGDSIDPAKGATLGDYVVGRGVYFKSDNIMHAGIAAHRELQDGDAASKIDLYFFTDT